MFRQPSRLNDLSQMSLRTHSTKLDFGMNTLSMHLDIKVIHHSGAIILVTLDCISSMNEVVSSDMKS